MAKIKLNLTESVEEIFAKFMLSRKIKGLAEKTLVSYQSQFQAIAKHLDIKQDISLLQKADLDDMIVSMRDSGLAANSINIVI